MKLRQGQKEQIARRVVRDVFVQRREALQEEKEAFGLKVYRCVVSETLELTMRSLPRSFMDWRDSFILYLKSNPEAYPVCDAFDLAIERPLPRSVTHRSSGGEMIVDPDLAAEFQALKLKESALTKDSEAMQRKVASLLASCSTLARLRKVWPEGAEWYDDLDEAPNAQLPAVLPTEINALILAQRGEGTR